jgi:serine/threonine protein kinase
MEPYPGVQLGQVLGKGGFAEVWEAKTAEGKSIALKFLPSRDDRATSSEIRAIELVRKLQHPGLIQIERVFLSLGYIVVWMELAEGSLTDLLDAYRTEFGTPIVPEQVCIYLSQVAEALDFMHARQHLQPDGQRVAIQHCDIKPSNMLLFGDTVKLADFGLSSITTAKRQGHRKAGTLDYTAPEVFRGELSDQTDQYALAVSYCLLRGGRLPFPDTPEKFSEAYVRPEPDLTMLGEAERPIVARALSVAPQNRWPTCLELISHLRKAIA